jgi:hypothetical protein
MCRLRPFTRLPPSCLRSGTLTPAVFADWLSITIETWYNRRRRDSTLGYVSPEQYEQQLLASAA